MFPKTVSCYYINVERGFESDLFTALRKRPRVSFADSLIVRLNNIKRWLMAGVSLLVAYVFTHYGFLIWPDASVFLVLSLK